MLEFLFLKKLNRLKTLMNNEINKVSENVSNIITLSSEEGDDIDIKYIKVVKNNKSEINISVDEFKSLIGLSDIEKTFLMDKMKRYDILLENLNVNSMNYDSDGKIIYMVFEGDNGNNLFNRMVYEYNGDGNISKIKYYYKSNSMSDLKATKVFNYDSNGNLKSFVYSEL